MNKLLSVKPVTAALPVLYLVCSVLLLPFGALADEFDQGNTAFAAGDFSEAYRIWRPAAEAGDARAQFGIASLYDRGQGVEVNYFLSASWYQRSARQGLAIAQFNLGNAFHHGRGVAQDDNEAVRLWELAAQQGLPSAQYNLGTQYMLGLGVKQDQVEARRWYQQAAEGGHPGAKRILSGLENTASNVVETVSTETHPPVASVTSPASPDRPPPVVADISVPVTGTQMYGADWLLEQDPEHLTLQLAVMSEETRVLLFIRRNGVSGLLSYFPMQRDGKKLFVLTSGIFENRTAALLGLKRLPEAVQNARPWIRRLGAVQEQIRATVASQAIINE